MKIPPIPGIRYFPRAQDECKTPLKVVKDCVARLEDVDLTLEGDASTMILHRKYDRCVHFPYDGFAVAVYKLSKLQDRVAERQYRYYLDRLEDGPTNDQMAAASLEYILSGFYEKDLEEG